MDLYFGIGMMIGAVFEFVVHMIVDTSKKANAYEWELNQHKLELGIRREKVIKDEKAAADEVAERFTKQLTEIVADNLVIDEDKRRDMVMYSLEVWTKFS